MTERHNGSEVDGGQLADRHPLVAVERLGHVYTGVRALDEVSVAFYGGEVHALLGANGAGKSTLVNVLCGAIAPTSGHVVVNGAAHRRLTPRLAHEAGIRTIHQEFTLVPHLSVADNLFVGRELKRHGLLDRSAMRRRAAQLLDELGARFDPRATVAHLSVAEQQQVEIARALAQGDAGLLIMDEPTSGLTAPEAEALFAIVGRLTRRGAGVIFISHRIDEVIAISDRATVLRDGRVSLAAPRAELTSGRLARAIVGRELLRARAPTPELERGRVSERPFLELRDVSNEYLKHVHLALRSGEVTGVFGLVGSGRTRLTRLLLGIDPARAGEVLIEGRPVRITSPSAALRLGIGLVPQDRKRSALVLPSPTLWNASLVSLKRWTRGGLLRPRAERQAFDDVRGRLSIKVSDPMLPVGTLSGGNQQKVCLARWLLRDTRLLVLDEPTRGVDVGAKAEIYEEVRALARAGLAVLVLSSEAEEIVRLADRAVVMMDGWIRQEVPLHEGAEGELLLAAGSDVAVRTS